MPNASPAAAGFRIYINDTPNEETDDLVFLAPGGEDDPDAPTTPLNLQIKSPVALDLERSMSMA